MGNKEAGFRIFGDELEVEKAYLDVNVVGADSEGNIYIKDKDSTDEWRLSPEELGDLFEEDLAIGLGNIPVPNHDMWKTLDDIGTTRVDVDINNFVDAHLRDSAKHLFQALLEAGK